jgi:hypothetical protein
MDKRIARHGHISYLEIPATDVGRSAAFYQTVFGWKVELRSQDRASFDDGSGSLIGAFKVGLPASSEGGILPAIYVDDIDQAASRVKTAGGEIVRPIYPEGDLWVFTFRDPAGNLMSAWQAGARGKIKK